MDPTVIYVGSVSLLLKIVPYLFLALFLYFAVKMGVEKGMTNAFKKAGKLNSSDSMRIPTNEPGEKSQEPSS